MSDAITGLLVAMALGAATSGGLTWYLMRRRCQKMEAKLIERGVAALDEQGKVLRAVIDQRDLFSEDLSQP